MPRINLIINFVGRKFSYLPASAHNVPPTLTRGAGSTHVNRGRKPVDISHAPTPCAREGRNFKTSTAIATPLHIKIPPPVQQ